MGRYIRPNTRKMYLTHEDLLKYKGRDILWMESRTGITFYAPYEQILHANCEVNRQFIKHQVVYLNEFLMLLGQRPDLSVDDLGWDCIEGWENYGYDWIDFLYWSTSDYKTIVIDYQFPPHSILTTQSDEYGRFKDWAFQTYI